MKVTWKPRPRGYVPDWDKESAMFCNRWKCCPADWNREHPTDVITRKEWRREQARLDRLVAAASKEWKR